MAREALGQFTFVQVTLCGYFLKNKKIMKKSFSPLYEMPFRNEFQKQISLPNHSHPCAWTFCFNFLKSLCRTQKVVLEMLSQEKTKINEDNSRQHRNWIITGRVFIKFPLLAPYNRKYHEGKIFVKTKILPKTKLRKCPFVRESYDL